MQEHQFKKPKREISNCRILILKHDIKSFKYEIQNGIIYKEKLLHTQKTDTLLHFAVSSGKIEFAKLLLDNGADVNAIGVGGKLPIQHAIRKANFKMVELLVKKGSSTKMHHLESEEQTELLKQVNFLSEKNPYSTIFKKLLLSFNMQSRHNMKNQNNNILTPFSGENNDQESEKISQYLLSIVVQKLKILDALHTRDIKLIHPAITGYKELFTNAKMIILPNFLGACIQLKFDIVTNLLVENGCDPYATTTIFYKTKWNSRKEQKISVIDKGVICGLESFQELKGNYVQIYKLFEKNNLKGVNQFIAENKFFVFSPNSCAVYINFMYKKFEQLGHCFTDKIEQEKIVDYEADFFQRECMKNIFMQIITGKYQIEDGLFKAFCFKAMEQKNNIRLPKMIIKLIFSYEIIDEFKYLLTTLELLNSNSLENKRYSKLLHSGFSLVPIGS